MVRDAVTFTCSPVESWWCRTSERHRRGGERRGSAGSTLTSRGRAVNARYPRALLPTLKISVFVPSLMSLLLRTQDDMSPPKTKLITFPSMSTIRAHSRLTSRPFLIQIPAHINLVLFVFLTQKTAQCCSELPHRHILSQNLLKTSLSVCTMSDRTLNSGPDSAILHHALRFISYVIV